MDFVNRHKIIMGNLQKSKEVNSYNSGDEIEAGTIAHALLDMEESFNTMMKECLPKLMEPEISEEDVDNILHDIGDELRHILYHIKDPKYFRYLLNEDK